MRAFLSLLPLLVLAACAATPPPPAAPPPPAPAPVAPPPAPPAAPTAAQVPPPPDACAAYTQAALGCDAGRALPEQLADALAESESLTRDRRLACIEPAARDSSVVIRALRADLAPLACADAIVTPFLELAGKTLNPDDEATLLGLMLAGRLSRLVSAPPELQAPFDKQRFLDFFAQTLKPWMVAQALAIGQLSVEGSKLHGYGKAVAAVEAGLADLRFVQAVRKVPLPTELSADPEVKNVYYSALDEALEPRKARGRDAALVGLRLMAELGALADPRVTRARLLLSELYGGSRVDALDRLILPDLTALQLDSVDQKLAARLPTYYALRLLSNLKNPGDPKLLRAFGERGLPASLRTFLDSASLSPEAKLSYANLELRRGVLYFAAPAFARAAELARGVPGDASAEFVLALARALEGSPKDAAALMLSSPRLSAPLGTLEPLLALAKKKGRFAPEAEFDAAYLASLTPPDNDAKFWTDLSQRFTRAAKALRPPAQKSLATDLAESTHKTAEAIRTAPLPAPAPPPAPAPHP
jgi:hypothetical protein